MDKIRIRGGNRLKGEIPISGAKNSALKLMAASLLTADPVILKNLPRLADIEAMADLLMQFGVNLNIRRGNGLGQSDTLRLNAEQDSTVVPCISSMRLARRSSHGSRSLSHNAIPRHILSRLSAE